MPNFVPGIGPANAKIAFVGEAPGADEDSSGIPFSGPSGQLLNDLMQQAGTSRNQVYVTNVSKYRPPGNDIKQLALIGVDIEEQKKLLYEELLSLRKNSLHIIVAVGATAMEALCSEKGITKYRGSILTSKIDGIKTIPILHPRNILVPKGKGGVEYYYKYITKLDIQKAVRESQFKENRTPSKMIQIVKSPYQLYKFLEEYKKHDIVSLDLETHSSVPICVGLAFNNSHAVSVPLFSISTAKSRIDLSTSDQVEIWMMLSEFLNQERIKFLGQNFKFDHQLLIRPLKLIEYQPGKLHADTSLMMEVCYPELPKNQGFMGSLFSEEPYYKDEGREFNYKTDRIEQLLIYNGKDVTVAWDNYLGLLIELEEMGMTAFYFEYENKLHDFYMELEAEGMLRDEEAKNKLLEHFKQEEILGDSELNEILNMSLNVNSPKQVSEAIYGILNLPKRETVGVDDLVSLLGFLKTKTAQDQKYDVIKCSRAVDLILRQRRIKKTIGTYLEIEPDSDGYFRSSYRISSKKGDDT